MKNKHNLKVYISRSDRVVIPRLFPCDFEKYIKLYTSLECSGLDRLRYEKVFSRTERKINPLTIIG